AGAQRAHLHDLAPGHPVALSQGDDPPITQARLSADGHRVLTATHMGRVKVWDAVTGREICTFSRLSGPGEFSPDGRRIVTVHWDGAAKVWDADAGHVLLSLKMGPASSPVYRAAFS